MRGSYRGTERHAQREVWTAEHVPGYMIAEVQPLAGLLERQSGLVALDVGANKGFWAKAFLNVLGDAVACIHMFDPSPENYRELLNREDSLLFDPADFARLKAHPTALGAARGAATLFTNEDGSPLASLHRHEVNGFHDEAWQLRQAIEVEVDTVDDFLEREGISFVDAMKLDVEGHEMAVLLGAERALSDRRIGAIAFEFGIHQIESRYFFKDFFLHLTARGYDLYERKHRVLHPVPRYEYRYEDFTRDAVYMAKRRP